ncbi:MAG: 4Fe-4S dicluster domain-containing protein [Breznakibacter sp.]
MNYKTLKRLRVAVAIVCAVTTFLVFNDIYEWLSLSQIKAVVYLQFVPSLLKFIQVASWGTAGAFVVLLLTALFGRIYCSAICPLGILQDLFAYIARKRSRKKMFFKSKKEIKWLRYPILGVTMLAAFSGFMVVTSLLDPYSIAGRFFTYLTKPLVIIGNNAAAGVAAKANVYSVFKMAVNWPVASVLTATAATLLAVAYLSYKRGRLYCNTICPVGTLLGLLAKASIFKIKIDQAKCSKCAKCVSVCKSECIDLKAHAVDQSRCVTCFNCTAICPDKAIGFTSVKPSGQKPQLAHNKGRRDALATFVVLLASIRMLKGNNRPQMVDGKKLVPENKKNPVSPPGSKTISRFNRICTGCGLCISQCPTQVLRPAYREYGLAGFMQPHMDYSVGECNFNCTRCGDVCPTGAILPHTKEEKQVLQIGKVVFVKENCVVYTDETDCGACSEHCPTKAVDMISYKGNLMIPHISQDICIGCGSCEHPCPLPPGVKAIYVDGNAVHQQARKPQEEKAVQKVEEDFPF